jgi:hypothetical protein
MNLYSYHSRFFPRAALLLLLILTSADVYSQYYSLGQDPASIQWKQIQSPHFKIIYPVEFELNAQKMANILESAYPLTTFTLNKPPATIPFILHTSNVEPNSLTAWAPKRIEIFTCPPQNNYAQDWLQQLAIHEYRHAVQLGMMNQGFTKVLSYIVGEQAHAAVFGLFVPNWYLEGDAVCTETALSHSGRGRVPSFEQGLRSQVLQKGIYSYDKAVFGSYKDYVPNQYEIGYQITANTRRIYGAKVWEMVMSNVARKPFTLTPFDRALKSVTGMNKTMLYKSTIDFLDSSWRTQQSATVLTSRSPVPVRASSSYTQFKYPQYISDSIFIAERTSLDDVSRFVLFDRKGNEKIIATPGFFSADNFTISSGGFSPGFNKPGSFTADNISIAKGFMAWTEKRTDPRWEQRNFSVIQLLDFETGKTRQITHQSRLFAPSIAPDASAIAAIRVTTHNICSIVLLDMLTGDIMNVLHSSPDEMYMTPVWSPDGKQLVFTVLGDGGKSIRIMNVAGGNCKTIVSPTFTDISNPVFAGGHVLFNGSLSGVENIYAVDTITGKQYRVTSAAFGACNATYNPHINKIVYSEYTSNGYRPMEADFTPQKWQPFEKVDDHSVGLYKWLLPQEQGVVDSASITKKVYESKPYRKAENLFNFHSWAPAFIDYNSSYLNTGVSVVSQNELSTATTLAGYDWDIAEGVGRYRLNFEYAGWYPVLDAGFTIGKRASTEKNAENEDVKYTWRETTLNGGVKVPLFFMHGRYYTGMQPSLRTTWTYIGDNTSSDSAKITGSIHTIDYRFFAYNYLKQSSKEIYPRWGQTLDLNLRHSPFGKNDLGNILSAEANLFFPGLFQHHGLRLYSGLQRRVKSDYTYSSLINSPRGYGAFNDKWMYTVAVTYKFPFLYPDFSAGPVAYVKRLKAALFYDFSFTGDYGNFTRYDATGIELTSDLHLLRFLFPFDIGARIGYKTQTSKWFADLLFSVNFVF